MIDHTDTFKTMGFCPTCERYTAHVCAKCQPATPAPTPDPQAEIAALRAERDALKARLAEVAKSASFVIFDYTRDSLPDTVEYKALVDYVYGIASGTLEIGA